MNPIEITPDQAMNPIEITPAMLEAGSKELIDSGAVVTHSKWGHEHDYCWLAKQVFSAMIAADEPKTRISKIMDDMTSGAVPCEIAHESANEISAKNITTKIAALKDAYYKAGLQAKRELDANIHRVWTESLYDARHLKTKDVVIFAVPKLTESA